MAKVDIDLGKLTNSCFVIMPFTSTYNTQYERVIRPAVEEAGLTCVRADEIYSKPQIMADIWKSIRSSRIVIAELTGRNTNVFYEVGLAHTLGKPVIITTRDEEDVPFDLKALRYLFYNIEDPFWGDNLKTAITDMITKALGEQQFGSVFEGIAHRGKLEYENMVPTEPKEETPSFDLTGVWQGTMEVKESNYNLNLHLVQKEYGLSGTMIVSYVSEEEKLTVVQEIMVGEARDDRVSLYGISYSYLQQGASSRYLLDTLVGELSNVGDELSGEAKDTKGNVGIFSLKKEAFKQKTTANT